MGETSVAKTGICKLCDQQCDFVKSHIVPKSFYGSFIRTKLLLFKGGRRLGSYRKGIYAQFLCFLCEKKFQTIDDWAAKWLIQMRKGQPVGDKSTTQGYGMLLPGCSESKHKIEFLAGSILWRAANCGRSEYSVLSIGKYNDDLKTWIATGLKPSCIVEKISVMAMLYQVADVNQKIRNAIFTPLIKTQPSKNNFGNFRRWRFGFPLGNIWIRLGGDTPKTGYFEVADSDKKIVDAVLWSSNLNNRYSTLFVLIANERAA